ncbi:hypothetical protein HYDPIDRAFT_140803 [Hydnomerulius pinastri MD-312]|uniref:RNA helicase n=1 Tax=Hydnomerulius pinastri MD-312 TaxID=994086 RepID=A0A0C9VNS5_9AGAM|nr:hypothetical protein HYDPIDRAFT_140803 [Hydnomerulius pinastri MD-312]
MSRVSKLKKRFNDVLSGAVNIDPRGATLFLQGLCAHDDPVACLNAIVESPHGLSSVQTAMCVDLSVQFMNELGSTVLGHLLKASSVGGAVLDDLLFSMVEPPIFWSPFVGAFQKGELRDDAQLVFGGVLVRLLMMPGKDTTQYRGLAALPSILDKLLGSSNQEIREIGHRIKHILNTATVTTPLAVLCGPGGRHDNDFVDFREIAILPTGDEVLCQQAPFIRPSLLDDPDSIETRVEDYLDNAFRMLREDMVYEMREEMQIALQKKKGKHRGLRIDGLSMIGVYTGTEERKMRWGLMLRCNTDFKQLSGIGDKARETFLKKDPRGCKILKHQSLACLVADEQIVSFGTINRVEELLARNPPVIVLQLHGEASTAKTLSCLSTSKSEARPNVLLVEEAGEILESHVLTALGPSIDQMILIGDHKQLRPKVNSYQLTVEKGDGFDLNRSLFERLVLKGFPHETLSTQHRMRPEISAFIRELTYPELQNTYEAQMVLKIMRYLAQQGYKSEDIVILTPYLGQLYKLRDALKNDNDPVLNDMDSSDLARAGLLPTAPNGSKATKARIHLATIDNYQGEESDIVIASLTRSNKSNTIGFMDSPERLNVLLSRARNGLILIGNSRTFMHSKKGGGLWGRLIKLLQDGQYMYQGLPVYCQKHPDRTVLLKQPNDFNDHSPDGGCTETWYVPCLSTRHHSQNATLTVVRYVTAAIFAR